MTKPTTVDAIRKAYLDFFQGKGHLVAPSASLIPVGDPTLLLTSAGMVQFKSYFTGEQTPPNPRLASVQKCFRTSDIDEVGDSKHLTFFEMLGNFSIGDYFKKEAIAWAWGFLTEVLELPAEHIWVTYYKGDEEDLEARDYWREATGGKLPESHIVPLGPEYNWWGPAGEEGPCGPCSEIHYSYDPENTTIADLTENSERAVEIWNLVFTQYYHHRDGRRTLLPKPNIDTGMGLARTAAVMQGVRSVYDSDVLDYLVNAVANLAGKRYGEDEQTDRAIRIVAEHARGVAFLIGDGVVPSNEGRGYVLRRILRRAVRFAKKAGIQKPFLADLAEAVIERMGEHYPELQRERDFILSVVKGEEEQFSQTLDAGMQIMQGIIADSARADTGRIVAGADVFRLYDTYGFPVDITQDIAREHGVEVDLEGFERKMEAQRQRGRAAAKFGLDDQTPPETYRQLALGGTRFTGYDSLSEQTVVIGLLSGGAPVERAAKGERVEVVLRESPFYPEGGGQVGDQGELRGPLGSVRVTDTQTPVQGVIAHMGEVADGEIAVGEAVQATVDGPRRADVVRNHTATHLLHAALRKVLGSHVRQAGSLVAPDRLRFDFSHPSGIGQAELHQIETLINDTVLRNLPVTHETMPYSEAMTKGALAFFGDKYGDTVRTCRIGGEGATDDGDSAIFSFELCGGTHAGATGEIGLVHLSGEGSIGAGTRRVEALTGHGTEGLLRERHVLMESLAKQLQTSPGELTSRVGSLLVELDRERKRAGTMERELAKGAADSLAADVQLVDGVSLLTAQVAAASNDALRDIGDFLKNKLGSAVIVLGAVINDRPAFVAMVTPDLVSRGLHAGNIIREVALAAGGGGGGRPELAQAGAKDKAKLKKALELVPDLVKKA